MGLGNPGPEYALTRHNAGFLCLDALAESWGIGTSDTKGKFKGLVSEARTPWGEKVILLKPLTYMNLSGQSVQEAANYYHIDPSHIVVISDDVSLDFGKLRWRDTGSAGGHNGLKSIIASLNTQDFPRLKIGVGNNPNIPLEAWVLGKMTTPERTQLVEHIIPEAHALLESKIRA